jgi:hypothetical protein
MIVREDDRVYIRHDLEELFGKVCYHTAHDAEKTIPETNPILLVMSQGDMPLFLNYFDIVLSEITPLMKSRMAGEGITVSQTLLQIEFDSTLSKEGLEIADKAIGRAFTSGILSLYQIGAPGYDNIQMANSEDYKEAKRQISNAITYRVSMPDRIKVTQRIY